LVTKIHLVRAREVLGGGYGYASLLEVFVVGGRWVCRGVLGMHVSVLIIHHAIGKKEWILVHVGRVLVAWMNWRRHVAHWIVYIVVWCHLGWFTKSFDDTDLHKHTHNWHYSYDIPPETLVVAASSYPGNFEAYHTHIRPEVHLHYS
jgi:hypothetical protein